MAGLRDLVDGVRAHLPLALGVSLYMTFTVVAFQYPTFVPAGAAPMSVLGMSLPSLMNALGFVLIGVLYALRRVSVRSGLAAVAAAACAVAGVVCATASGAISGAESLPGVVSVGVAHVAIVGASGAGLLAIDAVACAIAAILGWVLLLVLRVDFNHALYTVGFPIMALGQLCVVLAGAEGPAREADPFDEALAAIAGEFGLSSREEELALLLSRGRNAEFIADDLHLARETVKTHRKNIYRKLQIHSQQELVSLVERRAEALRAGVDPASVLRG